MKKLLNIIFLFFISLQVNNSYAAENISSYMGKVTWGVGIGAVLETGTLKNELTPGFNLNLSGWWPLTSLSENFFVTSGFGWDFFLLSDSSRSTFNAFYLETGLGYRYSFHRYFQPYGIFSFHGAYLQIDADRINEKEDTFKPGLAVEGGIVSDISYGFGLRFGIKGKFESVSSSLYSPVTIELALVFRYESMVYDRTSPGDSLSEKLHYINDALKQKKMKEAENLLHVVRKDYPANNKVGALQRRLKGISDTYKKGSALYRRGRYLEALPLLDRSAAYYEEASEKKSKIKKIYAPKIPAWERQGVRAYEKRNYDLCIYLMRRILLIDPQNRVAGIYLPRASKRKQALENLK